MICLDSNIVYSRELVGGKGHYLSCLFSQGFKVPTTCVLSIGEEIDLNEIIAWARSLGPDQARWDLAIRSSAAVEDSAAESQAGYYLSVLGQFGQQELADAILRVRNSGPCMAVVLQPLLDPAFAGVAFSCNPLTYSRSSDTVVWTRGLGDKLVAGFEPGESVIIGRDGQIISGDWPTAPESLMVISRSLRRLEKSLGMPVDIEWAIDHRGDVWFLQVRPVVLPTPRWIPLDSFESFKVLPATIKSHPKIRLRTYAFHKGVCMAPAAVEIASATLGKTNVASTGLFQDTAGVSVVLLHPERIDAKIIREFAPVQSSDVEFFTRECRRYAIRRYPRAGTVADAKAKVLEIGLSDSWLAVVIEQAVWDAYCTGIIRQTSQSYILELALGHFVPKGVVETSIAICSRDKKVITSNWRAQSTVYHFKDGHVLTETPPSEQLYLTDNQLRQTILAFEPLFENYPDAALEFGLLRKGDQMTSYLIDVAESDSHGGMLETSLILSGVVSPGECSGRIHRIDQNEAGVLDFHLHDQGTIDPSSAEVVIIFADRTSIDLLPLVGSPKVVGFIFKRGSLLAHLSVVLREKGIPAVILEENTSLTTNDFVALNATNPHLLKEERIRLIDRDSTHRL